MRSGMTTWSAPARRSLISSACWLARRLIPAIQSALAAVALLFATVMVNLAPDNPYLEQMQQVWNPGQFLNFHGLTQFAATLWPFLALPWLIMYRRNEPHV